MSTPSLADSPLRIRVAPEEVTIRYWGLRDGGWMLWVNILLAGGMALIVGYGLENPLAGWLTLLALVVILWRMWLPLEFHLGPHGIRQTVLGRSQRIAWTSVLHYEVCQRGVLLLPDAVRTPLSPLRGMYLPWMDYRGAVLANVEYYLASWAGGQVSTTTR